MVPFGHNVSTGGLFSYIGLAGIVAWYRLVDQFFAFLGDPERVESQVFQKGILFDTDGWDGKLPSECHLFS